MVTVMMVMMMVMIIIIMCGCLTLGACAPECDSRRCIAWLFTSPFVYSHLHFVRVEVRININADVDVDVCVDVDVADSDGVDVMICRLTAGHCWLELCWQLENWFCHHASLTLFHHHCNHHHHHQYHPLHKKAPFQRK